MTYQWIDYPDKYEAELENWCDEMVRRFAIDNDTIMAEHLEAVDDYDHNFSYFCKIVLEGDKPVGLILVEVDEDPSKEFLTEDIVRIATFIVDPGLRNQGYGEKIIKDFMANAPAIIQHDHNIFVSQVHKDNAIAQKFVNTLGFVLCETDDMEEEDWHNWVYPPTAVERYAALWNSL